MAAVVNRSARLWRVVHSTQVLPFRRAHFGAGLCAAGGRGGKEGDEEGVGLLDEGTAQFVEPELRIDVLGWSGKDGSGLAG